jgi:hypothetical protein
MENSLRGIQSPSAYRGAGGAGAAGANGAGGASANVTFDFSGSSSDMFVKAIRQAVRVKGGGNVQKAFGIG